MKIVRENTGNIAPTIYIDLDKLNRALDTLTRKNPTVKNLANKLEEKLEEVKDLRESIAYPEFPEDKEPTEEELESLQEEINELEYTLINLALSEAKEEDWSSHGVSLYFQI